MEQSFLNFQYNNPEWDAAAEIQGGREYLTRLTSLASTESGDFFGQTIVSPIYQDDNEDNENVQLIPIEKLRENAICLSRTSNYIDRVSSASSSTSASSILMEARLAEISLTKVFELMQRAHDIYGQYDPIDGDV